MHALPYMVAVCLVLVALTPPARAQSAGDKTMEVRKSNGTEAKNRDLVIKSFDAWRNGTGSPYDLLADDATWTIVGRSDASGTYVGREAFLRDVIRPFNARMRQGLRPTVRKLYTDGEGVVIFFDASGVARDGTPYANTYAWLWEMRDGKVVNAHAFFDSLAFNVLWRGVKPGSSP